MDKINDCRHFTAIVPIKKHSERLPDKNFLKFNGRPLYVYIIETLLKTDLNIIINTDIPEKKGDRLPGVSQTSRITILERPAALCKADTSINEVINHTLNAFPSITGVFQTHCTNPLLLPETITKAVGAYSEGSLISVNRIQDRLYNERGDLLNDSKKLSNTQDLDIIFKETSTFFIFQRRDFLKCQSRLTRSVSFFELNQIESMDINYLNDFLTAERLYKSFRA